MIRTIEYRYNVDGLLEELVCRNGAQEQVTRGEYGVDEATGSQAARADFVRAKISLDGAADSVKYVYNQLGDIIAFRDQNETEYSYEYDQLGRMIFDKVNAKPSIAINGSIRALGATYTVWWPRGTAAHQIGNSEEYGTVNGIAWGDAYQHGAGVMNNPTEIANLSHFTEIQNTAAVFLPGVNCKTERHGINTNEL